MKIGVNGIQLFYKKIGSGKPLILLHGNGETHEIFNSLGEKMLQNFTLYAIDSRNHGESTQTSDYSYETMAEDIYRFIKQLDLQNVNILGFSDGAIIALIMAMKHPDCLDKMALLGINLKPQDFTEESYEFVRQTFEETHDPLFKLMLEEPNIELSDVTHVQTQALVIAAEHDIFKPETFVALAEALPNAQLMIMPGHEHDSYIVNQSILYPDLLKFFNT